MRRLRALATEQHVDEPIEVTEELNRSVLVTSLDALLDWGRSNSVWPVTLGLACCAFEMIAAVMPRFDQARFGMEIFRASPRQGGSDDRLRHRHVEDGARRSPHL